MAQTTFPLLKGEIVNILHGDDWLVAAHFDDNSALVEAEGHDVGVLLGDVDGPRALHRVAEGYFEFICLRVPHFDVAVLGRGDDQRQLWVENNGGDVFGVSVEGVNALLGLVVPNLDQPVVAARDNVGLVALVVVEAVDAALVALEREIGACALRLNVPDLGVNFLNQLLKFCRDLRRRRC